MSSKLIFLGPPGCGKGTQAQKLGNELKITLIATGDLLRDAIKDKNSEMGKKVKSYVETGALVPDDIIIQLIQHKIDMLNTFILDGFPRTIEQAKQLERITKIDKVIYFICSSEVIVARLSNRRICPKCAKVYNLITNPPTNNGICNNCKSTLEVRKDDTEPVIRERIQVYERQTLPLIKFYDQRLITIDASINDIDLVYYNLKGSLLSVNR
ncbi:MAG: nucleoside monophosphate kinase [Candidatus Stahlbacteria bacterium]|nr:nucleoside monophosphate kinase [Candidatus Stahlbacteria bacterium]